MSGTGRHSGNGTEGPRGARRRHRARLGRQRLTLALAVPALAVLLASCPTSTALFEQVEAAAGVADDQGTEDDPPGTAGPTAPSGLSATPQNADQIDLSWTDNSDNEEEFEIHRKEGSGGTYAEVATLSADTTGYQDTSLDSETTYYYRVRAANSAGSSNWSNEANDTTAQLAAPSGLTATAASDSEIDLTWTDNSAGESDSEIQRDGTPIATVGADTTSYSDTGLSAETQYTYRVRATDSGGDSPWSTSDSATTLAYDIGDTGPAGGLIFFDDQDNNSDDYGFRYLEAAPASTEWSGKVWGGFGTDINGDDPNVAPELDGIGAGASNTAAIVAEFGSTEPYEGKSDYAAKLADDLEHNGYTDWFLPSTDELDLMHQNLHQQGLGGFAAELYWSSSENNGDGAWYLPFSTGNPFIINKPSTFRVRAARAFGDEYDIGDTGPAGGIIFYDDEDDGTDDIVGARYLEAAPASTEWDNIEWGDNGTEIGGDAQLTGIGDGQAATDAVVAHMEAQSITGTAAQRADGLSHGGYTDWFLPSKDELDLMYQNLHEDGLGGFAADSYWSSSEDGSSSAWYQYFSTGSQFNCCSFKDDYSRVRAARAFGN